MIRSAEVANLIDRAEAFGITAGDAHTDMEAVSERPQRVLKGIREGAYNNVGNTKNLELVEGRGIFESPTEIAVDDRVLSAETIVINTGARPAKPPIEGLDEVSTLDSTTAIELSEVPRHLAVVGGGYVGAEYAQMYERFGADVTMFQRGDRLLLQEDLDVSHVVQEVFESEGIDVRTNSTVERLESTKSGIEVAATEDGETTTVEVSHVLIAAGRQPNKIGRAHV